MDYKREDSNGPEDQPKYDSYKPKTAGDISDKKGANTRHHPRGMLSVSPPPHRGKSDGHRRTPPIPFNQTGTRKPWSPSRGPSISRGRGYGSNGTIGNFRERKGNPFDRSRPMYPGREREGENERERNGSIHPQRTLNFNRTGNTSISGFKPSATGSSSGYGSFDPNYIPRLFMPMVLTMPAQPMRMRFRYVLRLHSNHNPGGALSRIEHLFDFEVRLSRRDQRTRADVVDALTRVLDDKMKVSRPYSDPENWIFLVTAKIARGIPELVEGEESVTWPFIPITFDGKDGYMISVVSRCGPPYLDVLLNWVKDSGNAGLIGGDCLAHYSDMVIDEKRLDSKATNSYITHLGNGQPKGTLGYKNNYSNRDRNHDPHDSYSAKRRNYRSESPGERDRPYGYRDHDEDDHDDQHQRNDDSYKKMRLDDEDHRTHENTTHMDMEDLP